MQIKILRQQLVPIRVVWFFLFLSESPASWKFPHPWEEIFMRNSMIIFKSLEVGEMSTKIRALALLMAHPWFDPQHLMPSPSTGAVSEHCHVYLNSPRSPQKSLKKVGVYLFSSTKRLILQPRRGHESHQGTPLPSTRYQPAPPACHIQNQLPNSNPHPVLPAGSLVRCRGHSFSYCCSICLFQRTHFHPA